MVRSFQNKSKTRLPISVLLSVIFHVGVVMAFALPPLGDDEVQNTQMVSINLISLAAPSAVKSAEVKKNEQVEKASETVEKSMEPKKIVKKIAKKQATKKEPVLAKEIEVKLSNNDFNSKSDSPNKGKQKSTAYSLIENPKIKSQAPPIYPKKAVRRGLQGIVIVEAVIDSHGLTRETKVHKSSGFSSLDAAAVKAVKQWEFDIANNKNLTKYSLVRVPVNFIINNS